ncbi:MAG: 1-(5-phosphoribosyl)-5-[(5-phosphoribosylamino)methylideneamino]imidazole-4-carboxamide isomerase [Oscillospiraceae bacterium]|jgi:phosphoribosylformimino-5-aminoimidazole carboxamide ribotide isomerase|nr:1-(5-phosphoribosyl)-5-[(5-phosphoribosylamino)methylideneamino]imidazole-4-carboxamide isomerase [Oscillospiraceae bacterium]
MRIFPAIDLRGGKCVRLVKGDFSTAHTVAADALAVAADFRACGAQYLHCVDLDGAKDGVRSNAEIVRQLCERSDLRVELGGGLRSMSDLSDAAELGVWRFVIGSAAVSDPEFVKSALERVGGERIAVGVDALNGKVRTHGWERDSGADAFAFIAEMAALGVKTVIYTDISTDGTLSGPPTAQLIALRERFPELAIIASGGIANIDDVRTLKRCKMDGAIVGKAYYAGTLDLREAITEAKNG